MKKLYIIGIGPGAEKHMTVACKQAIADSEVIVGYPVYVDLVKDLYPGKEIFQTPMKKEVDRCQKALDIAAEGRTTCMVCSGDSGVYGMAGLIYELNKPEDGIEIEVIPGITAALSGGAVLGAPLTHDFAVISLSDLLTPWEKIEKRLACAADADFCVAIYNPSSIKRHDYLQKACDIMMQYKSPETVCGFVKNIGREGECFEVMTLAQLRNTQVDMFTTVFIGNSQTKNIDGKMITPRGYRIG